MDKRYKVILLSLLKDGDYFKDQMSLMGVSGAACEELIKKAPIIMKKDLSLQDARKYADAVYQAGGKVAIKDYETPGDNSLNNSLFNMVSLKNFIMCPQCGYKQVKTGTCIRCGFLMETIEI